MPSLDPALPTGWPPGPAWLFCPADRPERFEKALSVADVAIIDLEDAVLPDRKSEGRQNVVDLAGDLDPSRTVVRVNPLHGPWGREDLEALGATPLRMLMLPKATSALQLEDLSRFHVTVLCETASGILGAPELAKGTSCVAIAWGGQDLAADLGSSPRGNDGGLHPTGVWARLGIRYAAAAARVVAIDTVWTDIPDLSGLESEARDAASWGFDAKLAIHPSQVPVIRRAFRPAPDQVSHARRILSAAEEAQARGLGVVQMDGTLIDAPVIAQAARIVARSERAMASDPDPSP